MTGAVSGADWLFSSLLKIGLVFQVYLIAFAVQWNNRMESLRVAGGQGRQTSCMDVRQIQRMNRQAEVLFGKDHVLEPNFAAPMPSMISTGTQKRRSSLVWSMPCASQQASLRGITMPREVKLIAHFNNIHTYEAILSLYYSCIF